ncbi:MAG: amidase [Verrucomicrobiota bacterium]
MTADGGAFCRHDRVHVAGAPSGPAAGLTFAAKDVFAVAGATACFGNPTWLATHPPATRTAPAVARLVDAGATLVGLTITDELALSLTGENAHYGTPLNSRCPDRVPGGSSSGSASAVAGGHCDFALGTDTGGSVRVPAGHCGLHGFRPSHGAVPTEGVLPLAPRFDTVGWFARDARTLALVGDVLLDAPPHRSRPTRLLIAPAIARFVDPDAVLVFDEGARRLSERLGLPLQPIDLEAAVPAEVWLSGYLALQNAEMAALHGTWLARHRPQLGSLIAGRVARALAVEPRDVARAEAARAALQSALSAALGDDAWLVWPTAAGAAPPRGLADAATDAVTGRSLTLGALASLTGACQVTLPIAEVEARPFGVSLVAPPGSDRALLAVCRSLDTTEERPS